MYFKQLSLAVSLVNAVAGFLIYDVLSCVLGLLFILGFPDLDSLSKHVSFVSSLSFFGGPQLIATALSFLVGKFSPC